jgi:hypothetical protein
MLGWWAQTNGRVSQGRWLGSLGRRHDRRRCPRTVRDAAAVLDVISARMPGEPYYPPTLPAGCARRFAQTRVGCGSGYWTGRASMGISTMRSAARPAPPGAGIARPPGRDVVPAPMFEPEFAEHFGTIIAADTGRRSRR